MILERYRQRGVAISLGFRYGSRSLLCRRAYKSADQRDLCLFLFSARKLDKYTRTSRTCPAYARIDVNLRPPPPPPPPNERMNSPHSGPKSNAVHVYAGSGRISNGWPVCSDPKVHTGRVLAGRFNGGGRKKFLQSKTRETRSHTPVI